MIEDLIHFWKHDFGNWQLILKFMKRTVLSATVLLGVSLTFIITIHRPYLNFAVSLFLSIFAIWIFARSVRRVLFEQYGVVTKNGFGNAISINELRKRRLIEELIRKGFDPQERAIDLSKVMNKRAHNAKPTGLFSLGFLSATLIPLYCQILSWVYNHEIQDWDKCEQVSFQILELIILVWACWFQIRNFLGAIINVNYFRFKSMESALIEISFETRVAVENKTSASQLNPST